MTTITINRAIVEQALEVLKFCTPNPRSIDDDYAEQGWKKHIAAITALRAALAQQAEPEEPVWVCPESPEHRYKKPGHCEDCGKTLVLAQQAEPEEPVAHRAFLERILTAMEGVIDVADRKTDEFDALRSCVIDLTLMLHTAPPQRKPLTEEDIRKYADKHLRYQPESYEASGVFDLVRAIENASWEKNHG